MTFKAAACTAFLSLASVAHAGTGLSVQAELGPNAPINAQDIRLDQAGARVTAEGEWGRPEEGMPELVARVPILLAPDYRLFDAKGREVAEDPDSRENELWRRVVEVPVRGLTENHADFSLASPWGVKASFQVRVQIVPEGLWVLRAPKCERAGVELKADASRGGAGHAAAFLVNCRRVRDGLTVAVAPVADARPQWLNYSPESQLLFQDDILFRKHVEGEPPGRLLEFAVPGDRGAEDHYVVTVSAAADALEIESENESALSLGHFQLAPVLGIPPKGAALELGPLVSWEPVLELSEVFALRVSLGVSERVAFDGALSHATTDYGLFLEVKPSPQIVLSIGGGAQTDWAGIVTAPAAGLELAWVFHEGKGVDRVFAGYSADFYSTGLVSDVVAGIGVALW